MLTENRSGCDVLRWVPVLLGAPLAVAMAPLGRLPDRMSFSRFSASCTEPAASVCALLHQQKPLTQMAD